MYLEKKTTQMSIKKGHQVKISIIYYYFNIKKSVFEQRNLYSQLVHHHRSTYINMIMAKDLVIKSISIKSDVKPVVNNLDQRTYVSDPTLSMTEC